MVCRECDRNRRKYCSEVCSEAAVRQSQREARRRHQQSEEGLADHRDRNRKWRARRREQERVMDRCSEELPDFATMCLAPRAGAPTSEAAHASDDHSHPERDPDPGAGSERRSPVGAPAVADLRGSSSRSAVPDGGVGALVRGQGSRCALSGRAVQLGAKRPVRRARLRTRHGVLRGRDRPPRAPPSARSQAPHRPR